MRLISLTSNQDSFKDVIFNESGPSFIIARQKDPNTTDKKNTYNGVGKSLLVALVNFCLGASNTNKISVALGDHLEDWEFTLKFCHDKNKYVISRSTSDIGKVVFNNKKISISTLTNKLGKLVFSIPDDLKYLKFRALLPFFLRSSKASYAEYDGANAKSKGYERMLQNAFLLGLDVHLAQAKYMARKDLKDAKSAKSKIENDDVVKSYFTGGSSSPNRKAISEQILKLENELSNAEVVDDYYTQKALADRCVVDVNNIENKIALYQSKLNKVNESLSIETSVSFQDVLQVYREAQVFFPEELLRSLDEVRFFYEGLTAGRRNKLEEQKKNYTSQISDLKQQSSELRTEIDSYIKYLNASKAIDVYKETSERLTALKVEHSKIENYDKLLKEYEGRIADAKLEMAQLNKNTVDWLRKHEQELNDIRLYFYKLVNHFYPSTSSDIVISNDDGNNQNRYKISAEIQSDSSDGISSVKIFCYDLTLLKKGQGHAIGFVFHDSRLFSDIDELHFQALIECIKNEFRGDDNTQYIASINQNQLVSLPVDLRTYVTQNCILELTDEDESGKLLGVTVNLKYD